MVNLKEHFSDPDGDDLTFTAFSRSGPTFATATIAEDSLLTVTGTFTGVGNSFIDVRALDPDGLAASQSVSVHVDRARVAGITPAPFHIALVYEDSVSDQHKARLQEAADFFVEALAGTEVVESVANVDTDFCTFKGTIRGLVISITVSDGRGFALSGPCVRRVEDRVLPLIGRMNFDPAAMERAPDADFERIARHEMLHVLGIGTGPRWSAILAGDSTAWYFPGEAAVEAFNAAGGDQYDYLKVPVLDAWHWREDVMGCEVMSSGCDRRFRETGEVSPTSAITLGALRDIGWTVDLTLADAYTLPEGDN